MRKDSLIFLIAIWFLHQQLLAMNPFELFKIPDDPPSIYFINGERKTKDETTPEEQRDNIHDTILECQKREWGKIRDGYEEWRKHQNIELLDRLMQAPTDKFYAFVFWTRNIDFIKDFIVKAPKNMNLVPGLFVTVKVNNPLIVTFLIKEKKVDYMKKVDEFGSIQSSWDRALQAPPTCENLRVIYEYDKQSGGRNLKYFDETIRAFLSQNDDEWMKNYYKKQLDFAK